MQFTSRTVRSRPGLTQEEALESLQSSDTFTPGTKIASIRRQGERWVANLLEPKVAEFPPKDDGGEAPVDDSGSDDGGSDKPDFGNSDDSGSDDSGDKKSESKELSQVLDILHTITDALGIPQPDPSGDDSLDPAGADAPPPGLDGPPAPGGHGGPPPPGAGPAVPGPTPVGAPAFSSVQHEASCPTCQGIAGKARTFTAKLHDPQGEVDANSAYSHLSSTYGPQGYKVAQLVRDGEHVIALLRHQS